MSTDPLADRLRSAGEALSPPFSPELHATVMRQVRQSRWADVPRHRSSVARWATAAVAAAAIVGIGLRAMRPAAVQPQPASVAMAAISIPSLPSWSETVQTVSRPIAQQLADARLDLFDRSAGRLARYCVDQLDVFPAPTRPVGPTTTTAGGADRS